jgi:hypothetical protein
VTGIRKLKGKPLALLRRLLSPPRCLPAGLAMKKQGSKGSGDDHEEDHLIPLQFSGSWPQEWSQALDSSIFKTKALNLIRLRIAESKA